MMAEMEETDYSQPEADNVGPILDEEGAIDGKHIVIQAPKNSGSMYYNYKGTFSLVLLAVCDAHYRFTLIDLGEVGRRSDGGVFSNSSFGSALEDGSLVLPDPSPLPGTSGPQMPFVFVGDEAFPLRNYLLRPYPGRNLPEFRCAFAVFSEGNDVMATTNSVLLPFLKSLGIRMDLVTHIKENSDHGFIQERQLLGILKKFFPSLKESWPSHGDVLRAFQVFDTEGVGFIKVTMLKRFLVQAQLNVDEVVLERLIRDNCQIDGDDLINYSDFVQSIRQQHM